MTSSRKSILKNVLKKKGHFDSESIFLHLKKQEIPISRDAVFRNIPLLLASGIIQKSVGTGKGEYYEVVDHKGHHDHMICTQCNKIIEFYSEKLEKAQLLICQELGFKMEFHDHRIFGLCKGCQKKNH